MIALVVFTVFDFKSSKKEDDQKDKDKALVKLPLTAINHIELLSSTQEPIVLDKKKDEWRLTKPFDDLADAQAMQTFLMSVTGEKSQSTVVEGSDIVLSTYGLDKPVKELKVSGHDPEPVPNGKDVAQDFKIGATRSYDGGLYVLVNDNKVDLISVSWDPALAKLPKDFRDKHILRADDKLSDIKAIEIEQPGAGPALRMENDGKLWKITKGGVDYPIVQSRVESFFDALRGVRGLDFAESDKSAPGVAAKTGLNKPALAIRLYKTDPKPIFATEFSHSDSKVKPEPGQPPTVFAETSELKDVLVVPKSGMASVNKTAQDFYDHKKAFEFPVTDVTQIEVQSPQLSGVFKKNGANWEFDKPAAGKVVSNEKINKALDELARLEPIRLLEPIAKGTTPKVLQNAAKIILRKGDSTSEPILSFEWGAPITEKKTDSTTSPPLVVEAHYLPARTNRVDFLLGVTENEVKALEIASWFGVPPPVAVPAAPGGPKAVQVPPGGLPPDVQKMLRSMPGAKLGAPKPGSGHR